MNEGGDNVTLTIRVKGGTTQCEKGTWMVHFNTTDTSAQCNNRLYLILSLTGEV